MEREQSRPPPEQASSGGGLLWRKACSGGGLPPEQAFLQPGWRFSSAVLNTPSEASDTLSLPRGAFLLVAVEVAVMVLMEFLQLLCKLALMAIMAHMLASLNRTCGLKLVSWRPSLHPGWNFIPFGVGLSGRRWFLAPAASLDGALALIQLVLRRNLKPLEAWQKEK